MTIAFNIYYIVILYTIIYNVNCAHDPNHFKQRKLILFDDQKYNVECEMIGILILQTYL